MKRRAIVCSLLAAPLAMRAQRAVPARIGYVSMRTGPNEFDPAFLCGLRERGLIEGANLAVDFRRAADSQEMAAELVASAPAPIVTADFGALNVRAVSPATPIVHPLMADPIASGYTTSLSHPDGNVTGISVFGTELSHKRLDWFRQAIPGLRRVAALVNVNRARSGNVAATHAAGETSGVDAIDLPLALPDGLMTGFAEAVPLGAQRVVGRTRPRSATVKRCAKPRLRTARRRSFPTAPTCAMAG